MRYFIKTLRIITFFIFKVNRLYINLTLRIYKDLTFPKRKVGSTNFSFAV